MRHIFFPKEGDKFMTICEFKDKYYLHDSGIEEIKYDYSKKSLIIKVDFCFWAQKWYKEGESSNGLITIKFNNVLCFEYIGNVIDRDLILNDLDNEILDVDIDVNNQLIIGILEMLDYTSSDFYQIKIKAENVEVAELEKQ